MSLFEKLIVRICEECPDIVLPRCMSWHRTYAGRVQRQAGAWSWYAINTSDVGRREVLGSQYSLTSLLAADRLTVTKRVHETVWEVDPA